MDSNCLSEKIVFSFPVGTEGIQNDLLCHEWDNKFASQTSKKGRNSFIHLVYSLLLVQSKAYPLSDRLPYGMTTRIVLSHHLMLLVLLICKYRIQKRMGTLTPVHHGSWEPEKMLFK